MILVQRVMLVVVTTVSWIVVSTTYADSKQSTNDFQTVDEAYFERLEYLDTAIRQALVSLNTREWRAKHAGYNPNASIQVAQPKYVPFDFGAYMERRASEYKDLLAALEKVDVLSRRFPDSEIHKSVTNNTTGAHVITNRM